MARNLGPKHKLCRRLGYCVWGSPKCPAIKRAFAPGQHGQNMRRKQSVYGEQLLAKQKIRVHYGLLEKQMRKTFMEAARMGGVTGTNLLLLLESRLDTVVWRLGFAPTIFAARQIVNHGHILINGQKVDIPSYRVMPGMVIGVRERSKKMPIIEDGVEHAPVAMPEYLDRQSKSFEGRMIALPNAETLPFKPETLPVIGFYSR